MTADPTKELKTFPHDDWCNYRHGRCDCGATDQKQPKTVPAKAERCPFCAFNHALARFLRRWATWLENRHK